MAAFIQGWLAEKRIPNRLHQEGVPNHPADFESVAYFTPAEWQHFLLRHPAQRNWLAQQVEIHGEDYFFNYRQPVPLSNELFTELAQRDVYEIASPETYRRLTLERWRSFANQARHSTETYVFECCLFQNPLAVLTLKYNCPLPDTLRHIENTLTAIRNLNPILIYLQQTDPQATFERVAAERPPEWQKFIIDYTERGAWSQATGQRGFAGVIAYHALRQAAELGLIAQLPILSLRVDQSDLDWQKGQNAVAAFLQANLSPRPDDLPPQPDQDRI